MSARRPVTGAAKGAWGVVAENFPKGPKTLLEFEARQTVLNRMSENSALRSRAGRLSKLVQLALKVSGPRRDGRVVECVGLEIRYTVMLYRGFESLSLLQYTRKPCYRKVARFFCFWLELALRQAHCRSVPQDGRCPFSLLGPAPGGSVSPLPDIRIMASCEAMSSQVLHSAVLHGASAS